MKNGTKKTEEKTPEIDIETEIDNLRKENADLTLRLQNAMTMFQNAKSVINQREIIIEFLMNRLGAKK